ncbi:MAG: PAS domain S-box protein [Desulfobacterales bacterium]|nr:PAS domain S-box protein [Desulfobacterales bacterium]
MAFSKSTYEFSWFPRDAAQRIETTILNGLADIVAVYLTPNMKPTWVNQALIDASGYSKEALLSMPCHQCWFQSDTACSYCPVLKTFETKTPEELQAQTPDGRCWYIRSFPMFNENQAFEGVVQVGRDVTDRKNAEIAFQESETKYRAILNNIEDGYYEVDLHGNLTFFNESLCEILGYARSELIGLSYRAFVSSEDINLVFKTFNRVFATGSGAKGCNWRIVQKDGTVRYLETSVSLIGDAQGNIRKFGGITRDVTEQREAEAALRISEEKYRYLFEGIPVGLYQASLDGRIIDANQACLKIFRCPSKEALLTQNPRKSYANSEDGVLFRRRLMENGYVKDCELRLRRWDRSVFWASVTAHAVYDGFGNISGVDGSLKDISDWKEREEQLQESEAKYRGLAERCSDIVVLVDNSGAPFYWSPSSERILGYSSSELMNRHPEALMGADGYAAMVEYIDRIGKGKASGSLEGRMAKKDGSEIIIEWMAIPIYHGEQLTGIQLVGRDITTRKQAEEALRRSNEELQNLSKHLEAAREQERTGIAREVHDDLGQALTAIKFDLSWLKRRLSGGDPDALLDKIEATTEMADEAIQSVKRISSRLRPEILNDLGLEAAIEWYLDDFRRRTGIDCRSNIKGMVFANDGVCDELCISIFRIFQEALTNVARHSGATEAFVQLEHAGGWIDFRVSDNGVGIKEAHAKDGESFGLLGIRERVNAFGGKIDISGGPDKGTSLKVLLPVTNGKKRGYKFQTDHDKIIKTIS